MYFPPFAKLLAAFGSSPTELNGENSVCIPGSLFLFLLQAALLAADFDEAAYLAANPDVADAISSGRLGNARQHFLAYGYFEGRSGLLPVVDEEWYLSTYVDVKQAVEEGKIPSASWHFQEVGAAEGRAPSAHFSDVADVWRSLLRR